jgi:DNA-binding CsgD family transcriptional regulator
MTQYIIFLILAPMACFASVGTLIVSSVYRKRMGFASLRIFLLSQLFFLIGNCLELLDPTPGGTLFWAKTNYLFIASGPVLWFLFSMEYAGFRGWLKPLPISLISAIPAATFVLAVFNDGFHMIWRKYSFLPVWDMLVMRVSEYGPWLWVHFSYCYCLMFLGGFAILFRYFQSHGFYRKQASLIVVGVILPLSFNFVYLLKLIPSLTKDFSPISFCLGGVCFAIGIIRFRLSNAVPVPRKVLVDGMTEGILVVDGADRLVDINPAAARFFGAKANLVIGSGIGALLPNWSRDCLPGEKETFKRCSTEYQGTENQGEIDISVKVLALESERGRTYQAVFRTEAEARKSENEETSEGTRPNLLLDQGGKILASSMIADILDYPAEKLLTKNLRDIALEDQSLCSKIPGGTIDMGLLKRTGEAIQSKVRIKKLDGEGIRLTVVDMRFPREVFSIRENQIIDLLAESLTNREIGQKLFVSENTIKAHIKNMYKKTGTNKRNHFLHMVMEESEVFLESV